MIFCSENIWGTFNEKTTLNFLIVQLTSWWAMVHAAHLPKKVAHVCSRLTSFSNNTQPDKKMKLIVTSQKEFIEMKKIFF